MLSKEELSRYGTATLTSVFLDRVFQECLTYDGEMVHQAACMNASTVFMLVLIYSEFSFNCLPVCMLMFNFKHSHTVNLQLLIEAKTLSWGTF